MIFVWTAGAMFTFGLFDREIDRAGMVSLLWMAAFALVWPLILGKVVRHGVENTAAHLFKSQQPSARRDDEN